MINVVVNIKSIIKYFFILILASTLVFLFASFVQSKDKIFFSDTYVSSLDSANHEDEISDAFRNTTIQNYENISFNFFTKILDQTIPRHW